MASTSIPVWLLLACLYAVVNVAYGTIGHVLKCAPKSIACYNAQTYNGCAVGAKRVVYQASYS